MTHPLGTAAVTLGTAAASLLLTIIAFVALQPCARHDAEHAVRVVTNDLRESFAGLLSGRVRLTAYRPGSRPGDGRKKLCTEMTGCPVHNAVSRQHS
jgi:hypothetical protein